MNILAVYGTLKSAYGNHGLIRGSKFLGEGFTVRNFNMYGNGFPMLFDIKQDDEEKQVLVEVYGVSDEQLKECDRLEGHPTWYRRRKEPIVLLEGDDTPIMAWIYIIFNPKLKDPPASSFLKDYKGYRLQVWERKWEKTYAN